MRRISDCCAFAFGVIAIGAALIGDTMGYAQLGANQKSVLDASTLQILWRAEVGFQPIDIKAGDITGDGKPDVVIGYSLRTAPGSSIAAIDNTGQTLWRFETQAGVWNVAIGDIDGDGINDVAGYESQLPSFLYAIKNDGTLLWKVQLPITGSGNEVGDHLKIADVTGDGRNEVIVGAPGASAVYVFNKDGVAVQSYSVPATGVAAIPFIEVADLSGDGINDILISYGFRCPPCGLRVMDSSGNLLWDFPNAVRLGNVAVRDINNDGKPEVIASELLGNKVTAISNSGNLLWSLPLQGDTGAVALGHLKKKGPPHILAGSGTRVNLIDANGELVWTLDANANVYSVGYGNLIGGGGSEISAATLSGNPQTQTGGILFINSHGKVKRFLAGEPAPSSENIGFRDQVITDLDGDGIDEVVAISDDGFAYALQMPDKRKD